MVKPLKRQKIRPVGLVLDSNNVIGEWGTTSIADAPRDAALYAWKHRALWEEVRNGKGRARFWRKRYVAFEMDGMKVYGMRDVLAPLPPAEAFDALLTWAKWVYEIGANLSSVASTSRSVWTATLPRKIVLAVNKLPMPRNDLLIGGRQEAKPGVYNEARLYDINGAYQYAMREMLVGRAYRRVPLNGWDWSLVKDSVGFARATVYLDGNGYGPLPVGFGKFPEFGRVEGIWDLEELRLAKEMGARVYMVEGWIGRGMRLPWREWSDVITTGRELPGRAAKIAKMMGNSLWGSFAVSGRGAWVHYENGVPIVERDKHETKPPCRPLSAHISAFVRCRLYREALANESAGAFVLAAHTDGGVFHDPSYPNGPTGDSLGEWRERRHMRDVVIVTAQAYKYRDAMTDETRYIVSGTPPEFAPKIFRAILAQHEKRRARERVPRLLDFGAVGEERVGGITDGPN